MAVNPGVHVCSRDNCPPANVSGNKVRCFACAKQFYGKCFGIEDCFYDVLAPRSPFTDDSIIQFICQHCLAKPKPQIHAPADSGNGLGGIMETISAIAETQRVSDRKITIFNQKICDLIELSTKTNDLCQNIDKKMISEIRKPLFSEIINSNNGRSPPITPAQKRFRSDSRPPISLGRAFAPDNQTPLRPRAIPGTLDVVIGPSVPQIGPQPNFGQKRRFDRSIWISRFHPDTTVEQIRDYVLNTTGCNDTEQFNCIKLVKRDADLTSLQFISFKIDVNEELFESLSSPAKWPKYVLVREFLFERRNFRPSVARLPERTESNDNTDITPKLNSNLNEMTVSSADREIAREGSDNSQV